MNQQTRRILNYIKIIILILLFILLFYIIIKYNNNMKLVFFGDCMFGRNNNKFIKNPFIHVEEILKQGTGATKQRELYKSSGNFKYMIQSLKEQFYE